MNEIKKVVVGTTGDVLLPRKFLKQIGVHGMQHLTFELQGDRIEISLLGEDKDPYEFDKN